LIFAFVVGINYVSNVVIYQLGVFWIVFVPITIACNDCWAYFCGKTFGKTSLIKLSPNKTLEGFLGGAVFTFIMIICFTNTIFNYQRFTCINYRLNVSPYEPTECSNLDRSLFED